MAVVNVLESLPLFFLKLPDGKTGYALYKDYVLFFRDDTDKIIEYITSREQFKLSYSVTLKQDTYICVSEEHFTATIKTFLIKFNSLCHVNQV